ncbi:unnamed protein product [Linum tenue]|uniref:Uncharacterized protein n=1 Tax=Linum tenue TaxID=586396 RepID=A0AAV0MT76_9ROSI|nr:unnamed protein product [Linum tenue]
MDKYLVPAKPSPETHKPSRRRQPPWKRSLLELTGKLDPSYRLDLRPLLMQSYSQILNAARNFGILPPIRSRGISGLEFDSKGIYLASVNRNGCLTIHDFESLYCHATDVLPKRPGLPLHESKVVLHLQSGRLLEAVRWNYANQDEVACASTSTSEVLIYDIGYVSSEPARVLRPRSNATLSGSQIHKDITDIAFTKSDQSRLFGSDTMGIVNIWDARQSVFPCLELSNNAHSSLLSIQLHADNQTVFAAGRLGTIYMWDLRGGRESSAIQHHREALSYQPVTSWKIDSMLKKIGSLKAQSNIVAREIHSIDMNPSCPYQLAFHLDNGWSGSADVANELYCRKPSWLLTYSIYVVGSSSGDGIHLLDFYPNSSSPCHVDYSDGTEDKTQPGSKKRQKQNGYIQLNEGVTAIAAHPLDGTIIAGTERYSLLLISQRRRSLDPIEANAEY